ncbi:MAG TPA: hypothetical protein VFE24_05475 [Pirellulales bacterium]|nr:hypothetical protein [Pirellulales bacterium]
MKSLARCFWFSLCTLALFASGPAVAFANDGQLELSVIDRDTNQPIACRIHLKNAAGRPVQVPKVPYYHDHFVIPDKILLKLPTGNYKFEIERGPEYLWREGYFTINTFADDSKTVDLKRFADMSGEGWWSGDLDVRRNVEQLPLLMQAEDLHVVALTSWVNGKNDLLKMPAAENNLVTFETNRCFTQLGSADARAGGTLLFLNMPKHLNLKNSTPEFPPATQLAKQARDDQAWIDAPRPFDWDLPVWVANGVLDSLEIANRNQLRDGVIDNENGGKPRDSAAFRGPLGNGRWSQQIYYHLLDCGLRIPPSAGSGSGTVANPLGYNRVYVHLDGDFTNEKWWEGLRNGACVVTNGPLMRPTVEGFYPGHTFLSSSGAPLELEIGLTLSVRTPDTISYLQIVKNGKVQEEIRLDQWKQMGGKLPKLKFTESGWFLLRAVCDTQKTYRHAMTAPYYVQIGEQQKRISKAAAQFFLDWVVERAKQLKIDDPEQRQAVLAYHRTARDFFQHLIDTANAE